MSKEIEKEPSRPVCGDGGIYISLHIPEQLIGEIMEIIESIGLNEKQEGAVKSIIKKKIRQSLNYDSIHLDRLLGSAIFLAYNKKKAEAIMDEIPEYEITLDDVNKYVPVKFTGSQIEQG